MKNNDYKVNKLLKRKAILIGAPSVTPKLPGVSIDLVDIKNHLLSNNGGKWRNDEIITLVDPTASMVRKHLSEAKNDDYVFITCSGHGEHRVGQKLDETVMYLRENETIPINSINPLNKRHLVVVDVCRGIVKIPKSTQTSLTANNLIMENYNEPLNCRKIFDDAIAECSEGRIVVYSCDKNQSAGDDGEGGVFTQELLDTPNRFNKTGVNQSHQIININQAFETAKITTFNKNAPQSAVINAGRRRDFYPFSIVV